MSFRGLISYALTFLRLLLLAGLVWSISSNRSWVPAWVAAIIVADIADGVVSRLLSTDTVGRRTADAAVDRVCIHAAFAAVLLQHPQTIALYALLAARDVIALSASAALLAERGVLLVGGHCHKLSSLSAALFGVFLATGHSTLAGAAGVLAVALNWMLLLDYAGGFLLWRQIGLDRDSRFVIRRLAGLRLFAGAFRTAGRREQSV
jgi:phosphatidylglycerophosphate synthase